MRSHRLALVFYISGLLSGSELMYIFADVPTRGSHKNSTVEALLVVSEGQQMLLFLLTQISVQRADPFRLGDCVWLSRALLCKITQARHLPCTINDLFTLAHTPTCRP